MHMDQSPTTRGRRLMGELKRLREEAGLTPDNAARRLDFSRSKLYRLEHGRSPITTDDLEAMLDLYGVCSPQREALIQLGRDARRRGWWTKYSDVFTSSYVGFETEAAKIRINAYLVPGFLQTERYAKAIIAATRPTLDTEGIKRRVDARVARQRALFERADPPEIHVILDESVIRRQVGGPDVMQEQLTALVEVSKRSGVTIQILPFTAGAHAGVEGEFVILIFPDIEDPPIAYTEGLMGGVYLESDAELDTYQLAWTHILEGALNPSESVTLLGELSKSSPVKEND